MRPSAEIIAALQERFLQLLHCAQINEEVDMAL